MSSNRLAHKLALWLALGAVSTFYLLSAAGWIQANLMLSSGLLGAEGTSFWRSLTPFDHFMRWLQVAAVAAAAFLLARRRAAVWLFSGCLFVSVVGLLLNSRWQVSFLGGLESLAILVAVWVGLLWVRTRQLLF
jgi:hypothetical protein